MSGRRLPAKARGRSCTCPHYGGVRMLTHPACRVHGRGGAWKVTSAAHALWARGGAK